MIPKEVDLFNILQTAHEAGNVILKIYAKYFEVEFKDDNSPLTKADQKANSVITGNLIKAYPNIPILSEESKAIPYKKRKDWEYFWLIDPLDGTKEFVKKNGEFTVNIALVHKGKPILGIVYVPVKEVLYFGQEVSGAYKLESASILDNCKNMEDVIKNSMKLPLDYPGRSFTVVGSRSHMSNETMDYIRKLEKEHGKIDILSVGSSLKICMVAEGKADVYPRFGPTMEWDTCAGQAVAEFSGCKVFEECENKPLRYNKENLLNPWFIVQR